VTRPSSGYAAYAKVHAGALSGRGVEAEALLKGARLLGDAQLRPDDLSLFSQALDYNLKLWTVFEADLSNEASPLPEAVRQDLLRLCRFMTGEIAKAVKSPGRADLSNMRDINQTLAGGLMQ
jgi:flagellar biosynthesis activator protein FlaF